MLSLNVRMRSTLNLNKYKMKFSIFLFLGMALLGFSNTSLNDSFYAFKTKTLTGDELNLSEFKGKVVLVVNTASECGFTPQYEGLQALYSEYTRQGLVIVGFPANNFGGQEPGSDDEIAHFCQANFGVSFPMSSKVSVKGENIDPLFAFLTKESNPDFTGDIQWNFEKFLISKDGQLLRRFRSQTEPQSEELVSAIKAAL